MAGRADRAGVAGLRLKDANALAARTEMRNELELTYYFRHAHRYYCSESAAVHQLPDDRKDAVRNRCAVNRSQCLGKVGGG